MKNQYFGDINDYRKYGLLRCLAEGFGLRIGVCWLLTDDDDRPDGGFRGYLHRPKRWRAHDPDLFDRLSKLLAPRVVRAVTHARQWHIIPGARYFEAVLPDDVRDRDAYFDRARSAPGGCPLLFFDPDNGIEVKSVRRGCKGSAKYLYWSEIEAAFGEGRSLLVYQHFPRVDRSRFVEGIARQLQDRLGTPRIVPFRTAHVVFFLVLRREHARGLDRAHRLVEARWGAQISLPAAPRPCGPA